MIKEEQNNRASAQQTRDNAHFAAQPSSPYLGEGQERKKNVSVGGFIPDENEDLRTVSPKVMDLFRESESFNRNAECKTYPDYYIFGCFLATRNLKNPETREITKNLLEQPISIISHDTKEFTFHYASIKTLSIETTVLGCP